MIVGAACWSSGGFLVRQLSITDAWEIVFWRSLFMRRSSPACCSSCTAGACRAPSPPWAGRASWRETFLAGTFFFYIGSLTRTTVANTNVLMSVSPFLAALGGRFLLGEPVPLRTWVAMIAAFAGIVVMFADSLDAGRIAGNLLAIGVSVCFAAQVTLLRKFHATVDMLPQVLIAGVVSLVVALALAPPFAASHRDLAILAVMGWRAARRGVSPRHGGLQAAVGHRARPARAAGAHPRPRVGLGADGRGPRPRDAHGRRDRAVRRARQRGLRRVAGPRRRRRAAGR
jgi:drug/metabolite transporter (DMT)-like permease